MELKLGNKVYSTKWGAVYQKSAEKPLHLSKEVWEFLYFMGQNYGRLVTYDQLQTLKGVLGATPEGVQDLVRKLELELKCSVRDEIVEVPGLGWVFEAVPENRLFSILDKMKELGEEASVLEVFLKTE